MNACPIGGYRGREESGRGKRGGDNRRQNSNNAFTDTAWKSASRTPVDTSKLKSVAQKVSVCISSTNCF